MRNLFLNDIISLFVVIDDCLQVKEKKAKEGSPSKLADSEMINVLIWSTVFLKRKTIKEIYQFWITIFTFINQLPRSATALSITAQVFTYKSATGDLKPQFLKI